MCPDISPAVQKSAVLNGTGLMLAHPASGAIFLAPSFFRPNLALKNASPSAQTATVTVQYTAGGVAHSETLPAVNLAPHEVQMVDFSTLLGSLHDAFIEDAGIKIESSGTAGSLIAQLSSTDQSRRMCIDVPLTADSPHLIGTGAHPFHLDSDYHAVVHLKNLDAQPTTAIIQVLYDGGEFSPELVHLDPGQSIGIDIRQLRDSRAKDVHGHQLPVNLNEGQVQWFQHGKQSVVGRLVVSSAALGVSANFACGGACCPPSFSSAWVDPGFLDGIPEDTFSLTVWEMDSGCGGNYGPYNITTLSSCASTDSMVAQVSGPTIEMVDEGVATINVDHWASFFERPPTECESGPCEVDCNETDNLLSEAVSAIVRVPHHLKVVSDTGSVDNGCGAAERLIRFQVVDRNGRSIHPTRTKESFSPATVLNSCRGNETITPSSCSTDTSGAFTDRVSVGCPFSGGPDCGFDVASTWQWCPLRRAAVPLGRLQYSARRNSVLANGSGQFMEGQEISP